MSAIILAAAFLLSAAVPATALEIDKYDQLSLEDKTRYMTMLLRGSEQLLREEGKPDQARMLGQLFSEIPSGEGLPPGMKQFGKDLIAVAQYQQKSGRTMHVEHALALSFKKLGIALDAKDVLTVGRELKASANR